MLTLNNIKDALKIDYSDDDIELRRLQQAVISMIESYCGISYLPTVKTEYLEWWMRHRLMFSPFQSIVAVKYTVGGILTTSAATDWFLDRTQYPSVFINFAEYPSIDDNTFIEISYTSGYAAQPPELDQAVIALVGSWYNNPEATQAILLSEVPMSARFILDNLRQANGVLS
jgi:uncharacterized phiE125 gp8 family phage protein